ncbi:MAG: hypothetical protein OSA99_02800, partial [Acidimicrobiales bacterium]|nr:hypothetical protein [Acidimicrobiales bacterium]
MASGRWVVGAILALVSCGEGTDLVGDDQSPQQPEARVARGEAWEIGDDLGVGYGPFPDVFDVVPTSSAPIETADWLAVLAPLEDPLETFFVTVEDAIDRGFVATVREGGACWRDWQREEVPFGENGEGDGEDFGGTAPFGEPLPEGAEVVGIDCRADVERENTDSAEIWMRASFTSERVPRPGQPAIVIRSRRSPPAASEFSRQDVDVDLRSVPEQAQSATFHLEPRENHPWGAEGGCLAETRRSPETPVDAIATAVAASDHAAYLAGPPVDVTATDRRSALQAQAIPAGGPV